jgi:hypothetical protein
MELTELHHFCLKCSPLWRNVHVTKYRENQFYRPVLYNLSTL